MSTSNSQPLEPAARFGAGGRYRVLGPLGAGAFGVVYRVFDEKWGQELALKTIRVTSPEARQHLKAEFRSVRDIVHPNLVRLHELHVDDERCFFTMDAVTGGQRFTERLDFNRSADGDARRLAIRRICRAGLQLADALRVVHKRGKCHRDIKPTNVLITDDDRVVLLDFGLASAVDRDSALETARGLVVGTLPYLAPEQYLDPRPLPASDWYSVGALLYEALVGELPFARDPALEYTAKLRSPPPPSCSLPELASDLDALVVALLDPDPARRPSTDAIIDCLAQHSDRREPRSDLLSALEANSGLFVARETELATLRHGFTRASAGTFTSVEVVGPSGIGKTALLRRFLDSLADEIEAPLVLQASCSPQESIPYKAFDAAIDDLTRYWLCLDDESAAELCPDGGAAALGLLFPELRRVPVLDARAQAEPLEGDLRTLRRAGFRALRQVLTRLCARISVVLWVDDMQWADADSVTMVDEVFGEAAPPLALLLSRRPDDEIAASELLAALQRTGDAGGASRIDLAPLAADSARSLARAIADNAAIDATAAIESIVREAAGVPYLIAELAHLASERRDDADPIPTVATARTLLSERLARLSAADRKLVELTALCGAAQSPSVLLDAAGAHDRGRIRDLCSLRFLRWRDASAEETLQIYHDRLRDAVVDALDPERASHHHAALVAAMESSATSDSEEIVVHALAAGDRPRTHYHAAAAARKAEAALAFEQAARYYRIALNHVANLAPHAHLHALCAEALANAGHSTAAAPEFERAAQVLTKERPDAVDRIGFLRRRAGEQYLKAGHFDDGLRLMQRFLAEGGVRLPRSGRAALVVSSTRRARLYLKGFDFTPCDPSELSPRTRSRLDDLWAATTALSMMDPVRADAVGLLHFLESLRAGHAAHVARSLGYEAAFAALIGTHVLRRKAQELVHRNRAALDAGASTPYEEAFFKLGAGATAFFHSDWDEAIRLCDRAAHEFRAHCRGAEYEAAVSLVFSLQALGLAGRVRDLTQRIPAAIREADLRGDLFAANNYRGGFHGVCRVAAGQIDEARAELRKVVETWTPGFYQMHAYHRVFTGVALDLYAGDPEGAVEQIERDWPELKSGLFLLMELPAVELRWARARARLALAAKLHGHARRKHLALARRMTRAITRATVPSARPHAALLRAGIAAVRMRAERVEPELRAALDGYTDAKMAMHREVTRWLIAQRCGGEERASMLATVEAWSVDEGVPEVARLATVLAPGLSS